MAGDIIIRKAKKDYVCMCCNKIIKTGEQYLDRIIFVYGKPVRHDRYHDECPASTDVEKLIKKIEAADGDLIAMDNRGDKIHIVGVAWNDKGPLYLFREWDSNKKIAWPIECIYSFIDEKGNRII